MIFASGSGSNAENIHNRFQSNKIDIEIVSIFTNNPNAFVLERAKNLNTPSVVFDRNQFKSGDVLDKVKAFQPDLIVLAGFLWLIPASFVQAYPNKIINIHPALLPKFGGKGMYGNNVHKAVVEAGETESGITIHYVNESYDEGNVIFQAKCNVLPSDTAADVAQKIHALEYEHFPTIIEKALQ